MIIRITDDTTRLGFRITDWKNSRILADWQHIAFSIRPGQLDAPFWVPGGSPWYLWGYWPGKPTGVDVANPPPPDFPSIIIPAFERGDDCQIIFLLPERVHALPHGRYTGILMYHPAGFRRVVNLPSRPGKPPLTPFDYVPPEYWGGVVGCGDDEKPPCRPCPPKPNFCILGMFDLDIGQRCDEHIVDLVSVDYALNVCEDC